MRADFQTPALNRSNTITESMKNDKTSPDYHKLMLSWQSTKGMADGYTLATIDFGGEREKKNAAEWTKTPHDQDIGTDQKGC